MTDFKLSSTNTHPLDHVAANSTNEDITDIFQPFSNTKVTGQFDRQCQREGARQALESLYKTEYLSVFRNNPTPNLLSIQNTVDYNKQMQRRSWAFITIRPHPDAISDPTQLSNFKTYCNNLSKNFRFLMYDTRMPTYPNVQRWETVDGKSNSLHFHALIKMQLGYGPQQMVNQITRRVDAISFFQPHPGVACNIKKVSTHDYETVANYITKGDKTNSLSI